MKFIILIFLVNIFPVNNLNSQISNPSLIGYWQNWNDFNCPYIPLTQSDTSYGIIPVAFAIPSSGTSYNMTFTPEGISQLNFKKQIDTMRMRGKTILISIGGANHPVSLPDTVKRNTFVTSLMTIINTYGFEGIDIDLEGSSLSLSGGTISNPVDANIINLIYAVRKIMDLYRIQYGKKMILTMAPETAYVQGGMSAYGGVWGAYLPVIHALRDSIEVLHVQLYNSGSMYGIDGNIYFQGTVDFILSQTEAVIQGFNTAGGYFSGLRPDQVAVGLPACINAAGGGYVNPDSVKAAILYLKGQIPKPAGYMKTGTYADLRGMMDWSINWDATSSCGSIYQYAESFNEIFRPIQRLELRLFIEALYIASEDTTRADTVRVKLRNSNSPYTAVDSAEGKFNTNGNVTFNFSKAQDNIPYYLQIDQRNSIETWTKTGGILFSNNSAVYDLSFNSAQAFGNNMMQADNSPVRFGIYSGDPNKDGVADVSDAGLIDNDAANFAGGYVLTDLNGDFVVDVSDAVFTDNNSANFVSKITP
ncbi:MAG: chitinase [Ignavibacteria bacterium]|nr:chitinase [Ignavibacteria bacterium]